MTDTTIEKTATITDAAILVDGKVHSLPRPARHQDIIRDCIMNKGVDPGLDPECGFLTSDGSFVRRKPAMHIALHANQVKEENLQHPGHGLFTDDLW